MRHQSRKSRNFGFGRAPAYAAKNALRGAYQGHYGTVATHANRASVVIRVLRELGVDEFRDVTPAHLTAVGEVIREAVARGVISVGYGQGLVTSQNTVLECVRGDRALWTSPLRAVQKRRSNVRQTPPSGMDRDDVQDAMKELCRLGLLRHATVCPLARELALRFRESALLDVVAALDQAKRTGEADITIGTKGRRPRSIPVTEAGVEALKAAVAIAKPHRSLAADRPYKEFLSEFAPVRKIIKSFRIAKPHDLRAARLCDEYQRSTGVPAPVIDPTAVVSEEVDKKGRRDVTNMAGHVRQDASNPYVGGKRRVAKSDERK